MKASARLARRFYPREALEGAASVLDGRGRAWLEADGAGWKATVAAPRGATALLGEWLNEALSRAHRAALLAERSEFSAAVAGRLLTRGFPEPIEDPLEMLEPQVKADRLEDTARLLEAARRRR